MHDAAGLGNPLEDMPWVTGCSRATSAKCSPRPTSQDERSSDSTPPNIVNEHALPEAELLRLLERHFDFE